MATAPNQQMNWVKRNGGGCRESAGGIEQKDVWKEGASETWKAGTLLMFEDDRAIDGSASDSDLEELGSTPSTAAVVGQACKDATGTAGEPVEFWPIRADDVFIANLYSGASAQASSRDYIGKEFGIRKLSSGQWVVDVAEDTNEYVRVIGLVEHDAVGDTGGRCYCQFLQSKLLFS
jgi:hypothetical protein